MITFSQAIQAAGAFAKEMFGDVPADVEEIEVEKYRRREVWAITLSIYREARNWAPGLVPLSQQPRDYKKFFVDRESGEVLGVKIREVSAA